MTICCTAASTERLIDFHIPRQRADTALNLFARQADIQLLFPFDVVRRYEANRVAGSYTAEEALEVLLEDSGLKAVYGDEGSLTIQVDEKSEEGAVMTKQTSFFSKLSAFVLSAFAAVQGAPGQAQRPSRAAVVEEVTVTAQKRAENVQDVPIAINALSGDQLDALRVYDTDDVVNLYPNLGTQGGNAINTGFTIRGVGTNNFHITGEQAVGQYMDEITLFSPYTSQFALFDMERVEVLRGPQNTLFGRNTTGGAVNFITRKPDIEAGFGGYGRVTGGNEGRLDFEGAINVPLGDQFAARIAVHSANRDDIFTNLWREAGTGRPGENLGEIERNSGRIHLLWEPTERTSLLLNGHVGYNRGDRGPATLAIGLYDPNGPLVFDNNFDCPVLNGGQDVFDTPNSCVNPVSGIAGGGFENPSTGDWNTTYEAAKPIADVDLEGMYFRIEHDFGPVLFTSLTSYDELAIEFLSSNHHGPSGYGFFPGQSGTWEVFSQELRLVSQWDGPLQWIVGGFYSSEDDRLATIINRTDPGAPPFGVVPSISIDQEVEIWSLYGQADVDVTDKTAFTLGIRYTDDNKEGTSVARVAAFTDTGTPAGNRFPVDTYISLADYDRLTDPPSGPCPPPVGGFPCRLDIPVEQSLQELGWKVGFDHHFTDNVMGYASYSRGFKSGAFDTRALAAFSGTADRPVDPEFLDAYEAGFKSNLFDDRVELNGAVFFYDWEDLQVFDVDPLGRPAFLNVPETEIVGAELELKWVPQDTWYIQAGVGYLDAEIQDDGGLLTVEEGAVLQNSPEWTFNGLIQKQFPIGHNMLMLQTDFAYRDEWNSSLSEDEFSWIDSTFFINARVSFLFGAEQQYEISLWGENLTEEKTCNTIDTIFALNHQLECGNPNPGMAFYGVTLSASF